MNADDPRDRKPQLRPLDAFTIHHEGKEMLCLRDPLGIADGPILFELNPFVLLLLQLFDGEHSIGDIQVLLTRQFQEIVPTDLLSGFADQLEEHGYLAGEQFEERVAQRQKDYLALPDRPSTFAAPEPEKALRELRQQWKQDIDHPLGPGNAELALPPGSVTGILAPHIDYMRGGYSYAWAYRVLAAMDPPAETYVILGTVHHPMNVPFAATRKPFRTPLGLARIDEEFLNDLAVRCTSFDVLGDEFAHATEHSIELQVLYLQGVLERRSDDWQIVPILVGSFEEDVRAGRSPLERPEVTEFLEALETVVEGHSRRVCLIGGVDFAHVGPRFGGTAPLTDADLEQVARQDQDMLGAVEAVDAEAFLRAFFADCNARNVCSVAPIYCLLHLMNGTSEGKTLRYGQAVDGDRGGAVTFGSVVFTSKTG